jgi:hypothetical protein
MFRRAKKMMDEFWEHRNEIAMDEFPWLLLR